MSKLRFTDEEINMYATALLSYGLPIGANFFSTYFKVSKRRSKELEDYQSDFTEEEMKCITQAAARRSNQ